MSNAKQIIRKVDRLERDLKDRADRSLENAIEMFVRELKWQLQKNDSVATRKLLMGLESQKLGDAHYGIFAPDYWKYLEFGTGIYTSRGYPAPSPGPPPGTILTWIKAKGITPDPEGQADTQDELARVIANSMSRGTQQHKFVRPAWRGPRGKELIKSSVQRSMQRAVDRSFLG